MGPRAWLAGGLAFSLACASFQPLRFTGQFSAKCALDVPRKSGANPENKRGKYVLSTVGVLPRRAVDGFTLLQLTRLVSPNNNYQLAKHGPAGLEAQSQRQRGWLLFVLGPRERPMHQST